MDGYKTNYVEVMAVYYDFIPTMHQAQKSLWVQLRFAPSATLKYGTKVKLIANDRNLGLPPYDLEVVDVIGTRVILRPIYNIIQPSYTQVTAFKSGDQKIQSDGPGWIPLDHSPHWGYAVKDWVDTLHSFKNWTYGSGVSIANMVW